ncbi:MAG: hypothetical protein ACC645_24665 [Pirellulales bacterium]
MKVGNEYRIQTPESAAWTDEFLSQRSQLANAAHRIDTERDDRVRARFRQLVPSKTVSHGDSKVSRTLFTCFDSKLPADADKQVTMWIRDEWSVDLNSVQVDARQAGNNSPTIFVFLPKRSADLRSHFGDAPYGWDRDVIDGGLQVLLIAGIIRANDDKGAQVDARDLERKAIGKVMFKVESATVTAPQRIQVRKLFQQVGLSVKSNEELAAIGPFVDKLTQLAESAGGEAPKPEVPDKATIDEIRLASGNEQLLVIYGRREELKQSIEDWKTTAKKITERWPAWQQLQGLLAHAGHIKAADEARQQAEAIENQRLLLANPDPITPLVKSVEDTLRQELTGKHAAYCQQLKKRSGDLEADDSWQQLSEQQRGALARQCGIEAIDDLHIATQEELIAAMKAYPITSWDDRIDALTGRFARARELAAKELEPETQAVEVPRRTLKTAEDVQAWMDETAKVLNEAVAKGPVVIK